MIKIADRELKLGENDDQRVLRPAWTSEKNTGNLESYKHQHGRSIRRYFYERSEGLDRITRKNEGK